MKKKQDSKQLNDLKRLVESEQRFTYPLIKIYKSGKEFILINHEKKIYITPDSIKKRSIP